MVGKATLWAVLIELLVFHHQQFFKPVVPLSLMTTASAPYYPRPECGPRRGVAGPAFVLIRGGFHATFFHLDVPEFLAQATASDILGRYRQGLTLVPARFIIGVRQ
jgi:hypothetical protein